MSKLAEQYTDLDKLRHCCLSAGSTGVGNLGIIWYNFGMTCGNTKRSTES